MPSTTRLGLHYPSNTDSADVPSDVYTLANALDGIVTKYVQSATTPASPVTGTLWLCTDSTIAQYGLNYYDTAWHHVTTDTVTSSSAPSGTGALNQIWINTTTGQVAYWNGTTWVTLLAYAIPATATSGLILTSTGSGTTWQGLANTGVTAGTYGNLATSHPNITVAADGRITSASTTAIQITESQVTNLTTDLGNKVDTTRTISTSSPLSGGGDLTANRTITIQDASTTQKGATQLTDSTSSVSTTTAATPNSVKSAYDLATTANSGLSTKVPTTRNVSTTAPLTGGSSLAADLTLGINPASTSAAGAVQLTDSTSTTSSTLAATATAVKSAYDTAAAKVASVTAANSTITVAGTSTAPTVAVTPGTSGQVLKTNSSGATAWNAGATGGNDTAGGPIGSISLASFTSSSMSIGPIGGFSTFMVTASAGQQGTAFPASTSFISFRFTATPSSGTTVNSSTISCGKFFPSTSGTFGRASASWVFTGLDPTVTYTFTLGLQASAANSYADTLSMSVAGMN